MWQLPAGHSQSFYFWFFLTASVLFFTAYTVYATPFIALGYEMTPDYHERTRLQAVSNWIGQIAWLAVPWFYAIMANEKLFRDKVHGARVLAIAVGIFVAVFGIFPAFFCREKFGSLPPQDLALGFLGNLKEFFRGFGITFRCRPFLKLCAATFLVFNGYQLGVSFTPYVLIYYLYGGNDQQAGKLLGWFGTVTSLGTFCIIPLAAWISKKIGKQKAFLIMISVSLLGYALKWICYNPDHPYLLLWTAPLISFGIGSLFTLVSSMVADVCDYDELQTGQRREGMFGSIYWWMVKVGMALASLIGGFLLNATGFDVALGGAQPEKTLLLLRIFDIVIPLITSALAIWAVFTYTITEARAREIRLEIEQRRGR
jgi:GPH family glycoside/pentoside/hexuronide:cation symporter